MDAVDSGESFRKCMRKPSGERLTRGGFGVYSEYGDYRTCSWIATSSKGKKSGKDSIPASGPMSDCKQPGNPSSNLPSGT